MKKGTTLKAEIAKIQNIAPPKQYVQGWTEFYEQSSRTHKFSPAPIQYQKGYCEFYKLKFKLTNDVLIPRPETELLVDEVLSVSAVSGSDPKKGPTLLTILDIGTGSGCIAISVAKNLPDVKIFAIDISKEALKIAEENSQFHKVTSRIIFMQSDLLSAFQLGVGKLNLDVIVANLPYIPIRKLMFIDPMVRDFEPKIALDGGTDGFEVYRKLFAQITQYNLQPKTLLIEIDEDQGEIAKSEARKYFPDAKSQIKLDLAKKVRILEVKF